MQNTPLSPAAGGQNPPAEIFTDETAATYIGDVTPRAVRAWRTGRGLPFLKITNKVIRIRKADLDRWLSSCRVAITKGAA